MKENRMTDVRWLATDHTDDDPTRYARVAIGASNVVLMLADALKLVTKRGSCMSWAFEMQAVSDVRWGGSRLQILIEDRDGALLADPDIGPQIRSDAHLIARYGRKNGVDVEIRTKASV